MQDAADLDVPGAGSRAGRQSPGFPRSPPGAGQTASGRQVLKQCCRIQEVYPGSPIRISHISIPDPGSKGIGSRSGSAPKMFTIFNPNFFFLLARVSWPLLFLCRPFCIFYRCLDSNQRVVVARRRATNLATHLHINLATHLLPT